MLTKYADVQNEYNKDKQLKPEDVKNFKEWVDKQPHLPNISELQAILFLQSCYYSNEQAKITIDTYFTVKTLCPDIFGNRDPNKNNLKDSLKVTLFYPLPQQTPDGYNIIIMKMIDLIPDHFEFAHQLRNFDMITLLNLYQKGAAAGHLIIVDFDGITFGHVTKLGIMTMKKFLYYLQEAMPLRLKGLHYFNIVPFIDKVVALMRPFMKKELFEILYLHENVQGLTKFLPLECMPADYGGNQEPIATLHEKYIKLISDNAEHFINEEKMVVNESLRPGKPKNAGDIFGVEGTFKKLDID